MRIALQLGKTIQELYEEMSAYEFSLWAAYFVKEPWGDDRADFRNAQLIANLVNMSGKSLPSGRQASIKDFMPYQFKEDEVVEEMDPLKFFGMMHNG